MNHLREKKSKIGFFLHARISGNSRPHLKNLKSSPPGAKVAMAQPNTNSTKIALQRKDTEGKDYSFLFVDARFGGAGGAYNGSTNKRKKDDSKKPRNDGGGRGSPDDHYPDDNGDNDDSGDNDTPNVDRHSVSSSSNPQHSNAELKQRAKLPTLSPKSLTLDGV